MYKISEFSKIAKLTIKALRYYDEEGILSPSYRDEVNSYRYYDDNDFERAGMILMLRNLEFSISEIKEILLGCDKPKDLSYYLEEKRRMIEAKISAEKELVKRMNLYIKRENMEECYMDYSIELKQIEPVIVASVRYKGKYSDVGNYIGTIYKAVKNKGAGVPFNCYYDEDYKEEADIELCVPTTELIHDSGITSRKLPGIRAICTTHKGGYDKLNLAYKTLLDYAKEHCIKCTVPSREVYIKGPGMIFKGNPNNYITEIIIPIEEI